MPVDAGFVNYLGYSASNFFARDYEGVSPANGYARFLSISESGLGLLIFGFLVTSLFLWVSKL